MIKFDSNKAILYDADVIIHFITGDRLLDLFNLYPNKNLILETVYTELAKSPATKITLDNLIALKVLTIIPFPTNYEIIKEFAHLTSSLMNKGRGESACMAYCKHTKDVIASSNLTDIRKYCELHDITYLTTFDFIHCAYVTGKWTISDCESFIARLVQRKHHIPFSSFKDFAKAENISLDCKK